MSEDEYKKEFKVILTRNGWEYEDFSNKYGVPVPTIKDAMTNRSRLRRWMKFFVDGHSLGLNAKKI